MSTVELGDLVFNIISKKDYANCRFCLRKIDGEFATVENVFHNPNNQLVSNILQSSSTLKLQLQDSIPGINAVCLACVYQLEQVAKFLEMCIYCNQKLEHVITTLSEKLQYESNFDDIDNLYVVIDSKNEVVEFLTNSKSTPEEVFVKDESSMLHSNLNNKVNESDKTVIDKKNHQRSKAMFKCPDCDVSKRSIEALEHHQNKLHNQHVCKDCGKSYIGLDKLKVHEEKHHCSFECPTCNKLYQTREFFTRHVKQCTEGVIEHRTRDSIEKTYQCTECDKCYVNYNSLRVHQRFSHENAKHHDCEVCGKQFTAPSVLKIHMITHTKERNFHCILCNKKFVSKESLLYHTRRHTGERPYSCKLCDEKFVNASARAEHIKYKHIGPTLECDICLKKFVTKSFLRQHKNRHLDQQFSVPTCANGQQLSISHSKWIVGS